MSLGWVDFSRLRSAYNFWLCVLPLTWFFTSAPLSNTSISLDRSRKVLGNGYICLLKRIPTKMPLELVAQPFFAEVAASSTGINQNTKMSGI